MLRAALVLSVLFLIGCTNRQSTPVENSTTQPPSVSTAATIPSIQIEMADRSCEKDSDCVNVATQCSCSCGEGVNKTHAKKYEEALTKLCTSYNGIMCKVLCKGSVKCRERVCSYVNN